MIKRTINLVFLSYLFPIIIEMLSQHPILSSFINSIFTRHYLILNFFFLGMFSVLYLIFFLVIYFFDGGEAIKPETKEGINLSQLSSFIWTPNLFIWA